MSRREEASVTQPFPTVDAADRWKAAHTRQYGHTTFEQINSETDEATT